MVDHVGISGKFYIAHPALPILQCAGLRSTFHFTKETQKLLKPCANFKRKLPGPKVDVESLCEVGYHEAEISYFLSCLPEAGPKLACTSFWARSQTSRQHPASPPHLRQRTETKVPAGLLQTVDLSQSVSDRNEVEFIDDSGLDMASSQRVYSWTRPYFEDIVRIAEANSDADSILRQKLPKLHQDILATTATSTQENGTSDMFPALEQRANLSRSRPFYSPGRYQSKRQDTKKTPDREDYAWI